MNAIGSLLRRHLLEPWAILCSPGTIELLRSSLPIWRAARDLFRSLLAGTYTPVATPAGADWKLRTAIYGFGNVVTTCRGSPAAISREQMRDHWDAVRAHFAPFEDLLQLVARLRALALALLYPGTLLSSGLLYDELEKLAPALALLAILWLLLRFAVPALLRRRLRALLV